MKRITVLLLVAILALGFIPGSATVLGGGGTTYTVQRGDSLSEIAARHGTTVAELVRLNADRYPSLRSNPGLIEPGWVLVLPDGDGGTGETLWGRAITWVKTRVVPAFQEAGRELTAPQPSAQRGRTSSGASAGASATPGATGASSVIHVGDPASEEAILAMINEERARLGLGLLEMDEDLRARSRERSRDMLERGYFSHYDPVTGEPLCSAAAEVAARGRGWGATGFEGAKRAAHGWWSSPEHYAIITNGDLHRIGIGGSVMVLGHGPGPSPAASPR